MTYLINCLKIYIVINFYYLKVLFSYYFPPYFLGKWVYKNHYFFKYWLSHRNIPPSPFYKMEKYKKKDDKKQQMIQLN